MHEGAPVASVPDGPDTPLVRRGTWIVNPATHELDPQPADADAVQRVRDEHFRLVKRVLQEQEDDERASHPGTYA
jgi:hypothetical protein